MHPCADARDATPGQLEKTQESTDGAEQTRSTPTPCRCKTSVSLSRGQSVRDEPRTINGEGGAEIGQRNEHRCEDGSTQRRSAAFAYSRIAKSFPYVTFDNDLRRYVFRDIFRTSCALLLGGKGTRISRTEEGTMSKEAAASGQNLNAIAAVISSFSWI